MLDDRPSDFGFEAHSLHLITLGVRETGEYGPDISVICLPRCDQLDTLKAKKSFWSLTANTTAKIAAALDERGCVAIAGHPAEDLNPDAGLLGGF
jgi:hypothetical protein